jgi:hypothetical protein
MHVAHYENLEKTALEANNSPKIIRESIWTLLLAKKRNGSGIRPLVNTPTNGTKNFGMSKPSKSKKNRNNISNRKKLHACEESGIREVYPRGKLHKINRIAQD